MRLMKKTALIIIKMLIAITLVNCSNSSAKDVLEFRISEKLVEYNLFSDVRVFGSSEKGVTVEIHFKNKKHSKAGNNNKSLFFLDEKSNLQLIDLLAYSCNQLIIDNCTTSFELTFEGYTDRIIKRFSHKDVEKVMARFNKAKKFHPFAEYVFKEMGYIGVMESTQMIKYLNKNFNDMFNYQGDFWDLLYDYSVACENPNEDPKSIYLFISFAGSMRVDDDIYQNSIYRKHMKYFLNECGYEEKLLDYTAVELIDFIGNKYDLNKTERIKKN